MVAIIKTGHSIPRSFFYNENKVKAGIAVCIYAGNYPDEASNLSQRERLNMLLKLAALNENVVRNSVHISLNFDPSEVLSNDKLTEIASTYMEGIGFGQQPFLVYNHHDAGHPHIHIVSVKIDANGRRIETQNIGRGLSEAARKRIEIDFDLVKAGSGNQLKNVIRPAVIKANYGKMQTKNAISNVLNTVIEQYKFTSLAELNAVLRQYNVLADRGEETSRTYQKNGLVFSVLNANGKRIGVPIKASDFYQKPTLKNLESRFKANEEARVKHKSRVKNAIDLALLRNSNLRIPGLQAALKGSGIDVILRENSAGLLYGITYVDHQTKCVFNGSDLGKNYSAKAIAERCAGETSMVKSQSQFRNHNQSGGDHAVRVSVKKPDSTHSSNENFNSQNNEQSLESNLLDPLKPDNYMPFQLRRSRRKKQRRRGQQL